VFNFNFAICAALTFDLKAVTGVAWIPSQLGFAPLFQFIRLTSNSFSSQSQVKSMDLDDFRPVICTSKVRCSSWSMKDLGGLEDMN